MDNLQPDLRNFLTGAIGYLVGVLAGGLFIFLASLLGLVGALFDLIDENQVFVQILALPVSMQYSRFHRMLLFDCGPLHYLPGRIASMQLGDVLCHGLDLLVGHLYGDSLHHLADIIGSFPSFEG